VHTHRHVPIVYFRDQQGTKYLVTVASSQLQLKRGATPGRQANIMPLGIERLNARKSQPNGHVNFIKPLKGPDEAIAQDYLERIAAQCRM
jgi:hypothetical protein